VPPREGGGIQLGALSMLTRLPLALLGAILGCGLSAIPADAQRARVFVASYGNDSNPCTFGSPCKTFQAAHDAVAAGGEITAIDSAGFGPVNINKAVTITSPPGIEASIAVPPGGTAIAVAAGANDIITLRGLTLNGAGSGGTGVFFTTGAKLAVIDCVITNFTQDGILVHPSAATDTLVLVSNTIVTETPGGIVLSTFGPGGVQATFGGLTLDNNTDSIELITQGGPINLMVANSQIGHNTQIGIYSSGGSAGPGNHLYLKNVTFSGNMPHEIYLDTNTLLWLSQVTQQVSDNSNTGAGVFCPNPGSGVFTDLTNHINSFGQCTKGTNPPN